MNHHSRPSGAFGRRDFLKLSASAGLLAGFAPHAGAATKSEADASATPSTRRFNEPYEGGHLSRVAFPLGGIGGGMVCLEGTGALSQVSIRNEPDVFNEPCLFAAVSVRGAKPVARVLEGPVPAWKLFGLRGAAGGAGGHAYGLPRCDHVRFTARFPFATVELADAELPLKVELTGWSPFTPGRADRSSLPVAALEYRFTNASAEAVAAVFSFNAKHFLLTEDDTPATAEGPLPGGFVFRGSGTADAPWRAAAFAVAVDAPEARVNHAWFRGGWFDPLTMAWKDIESGACYDRAAPTEGTPSPGATIFVPLELAAGASRTIAVRLCWFTQYSRLHVEAEGTKQRFRPAPDPKDNYRPWYAGQFAGIEAVAAHWRSEYAALRHEAEVFRDALFDSTFPPEVIEAVAANLAILKTPTVLRQADGRIWAWEGCNDDSGCCPGNCTHVWNYAQAMPHLFPDLERGLRETEFGPNQDAEGHQQFRALLPIRPVGNAFHAASDGQLGGIMKVHREWRVSGDTEWLRRLWPAVRRSLDYCVRTWDPERKGWLEEPHHNTYDIEFWGPDGMCSSFYLGALKAAVIMGQALGEDIAEYAGLLERGLKRVETELFNGEYFHQRIEWKKLRAADPTQLNGPRHVYSPEAKALLLREGPKYQYGTGCLSDGVLGSWIALVCGVGQVLDAAKVTSHLRAVHRHNLKHDLSAHVNPQRSSYANGAEGGLLLCTWPKGGELSLPFVYSNEVWTGIEYQVASHLIFMGCVAEGLEIVRTCRARYDGQVRNPFDEYECGHFYARALASYGLLQALGGARYDAVDRVLHLTPRVRGDFRCFLATATGFGVVGVAAGQPFLDVRWGKIDVARIAYTPAGASA